MAMMEKMKDKLPGVKGKAEAPDMMEKKKTMPGIEIEIGEEDETESPDEGSLSESSDEETVAVGELAQLSDEELLAEVKKRGLEVASGGASIMSLPEAESEGEAPAPKKPAKA